MAYSEAWNAADNSPAERELLFRERPSETLGRIALGMAWRLRPARISGVPELAALHLKEWVSPSRSIPDPEATLKRVANVAGVAHDLEVGTLVDAFTQGVYPRSHVLAPKWMSPPERCLLFYPDFHITRRFRPVIRQQRFRVTFDRAFDRVIKACSQPRVRRWNLTWITPKLMHAYAALHEAGYAHSFEVWNANDDLVGGGYGVSVGRYYALESMFCFEDNSSKVGFAFLSWHLAHWGFAFTDIREFAPYKLELGSKLTPRKEFLAMLPHAVDAPSKRGRWDVEADAATVAAWKPGTT